MAPKKKGDNEFFATATISAQGRTLRLSAK